MGIMLNFMATPVVIVGAKHGGVKNAMTAAWVTQVSYRPCLVAVAVAPERYTHHLIQESHAFALSFLKVGQEALARRLGQCSGAALPNKLDKIPLVERQTGSPILADAGAFLDCRVVASHVAGDHTIFVGEVLDHGTEGGSLLAFHPSLYT